MQLFIKIHCINLIRYILYLVICYLIYLSEIGISSRYKRANSSSFSSGVSWSDKITWVSETRDRITRRVTLKIRGCIHCRTLYGPVSRLLSRGIDEHPVYRRSIFHSHLRANGTAIRLRRRHFCNPTFTFIILRITWQSMILHIVWFHLIG